MFVTDNTVPYPKLAKLITVTITEALGEVVYCWVSVHINVNTGCEFHRDKLNAGPSLIYLGGQFTGGVNSIYHPCKVTPTRSDIGKPSMVDTNILVVPSKGHAFL